METAPAPLPSARDIAMRPQGVWVLRGLSHAVAQPQPLPAGPFKLLLQRSGRAELSQGGRRVVLQARQFTLVDGAQPFSLAAADGFEQVLVSLPRPAVLARARGLERRTALALGDSAAESLVLDFVQSLAAQAPRLQGAALWHAQAALISLLGGLGPVPAADPHADLMQRALALIELEIADIDAEALAARLGVSRRHLDSVFSRSGRTLGQHLWERRLSLAADQLRGPGQRSVTEVAHAVGFKDSSHFTRAFRRRHGVTPSAWRRLA